RPPHRAEPQTSPVPLTLVVDTTEPELRDGNLIEARVTKRFELPIASVTVSRERQTLSNGLEERLLEVSRQLRRPALNARWTRDDLGWVAKQQSAWVVDAPLTRAYLLESLRYAKTEARVAVRRAPPAMTVKRLFDAGFRYHFGGGESLFAGSPDFRVQNIIAGAKQIDGRILGRGEVFDFNRSVRLSARNGFVPGYVIRGSLLEKDIGGGICQVSTTVWRAAYQAGLPIVERHQHSYRVAYYDPPGMEATVYAPPQKPAIPQRLPQRFADPTRVEHENRYPRDELLRCETRASRDDHRTARHERNPRPSRPFRARQKRQPRRGEARQRRGERHARPHRTHRALRRGAHRSRYHTKPVRTVGRDLRRAPQRPQSATLNETSSRGSAKQKEVGFIRPPRAFRGFTSLGAKARCR
ncbi:MAG: hypothetical protein HC933_20310, partial [Pleurocapsa sp. SU_196_0]|nr:hypothetical protein [Pleurocapsa sp. SU_196_0]